MTKLTKVSVGIAVALFGCTSSPSHTGNPGTAGTSPGTAGAQSTAGSSGTAGTGSGTAGQTGGSPGTGGSTGGTPGTAGTGTAGMPGTAGTGTAGTPGTAGTGTAGTTPADDSVLERGKNPARTGNYIQPTLTAAMAAKMMPDATFNTNAAFTNPTKDQMYSSPLYLANGPGGKGIFIAATTNNDVKAYDDSGTPVWTRNFGAFVKGSAQNLFNRLSTPVIDATAGADGLATIYVCAPVGATAGGNFDHYELHAISAKDGTERTGWPAKIDGTIKATNDGLNRAFTPLTEAQRPALSLVNGVVYIGFGGPYGDFSVYYGWVIAVDTKNPATIGAWSTRLGGGAVWTPGGFASDGDGVIVTTGNFWANMGYMAPAMFGDSEAIVRLSGMPSALARKDEYTPMRWRQMDQDDQDLGSSSVMLLDVPGATPSKYAVTVSKDSHLYFNNAAALGTAGGGGEVVDLQLTTTITNHSARTSPVTYTTASGIHVAVTIDRGPYTMCPATPAVDPNMAILMGFTVTPSPFKVTADWCTNVGGPAMGDNGTVKNRSVSPLVTTTDGKANPIVWVGGSMSQATANTPANMLYGVDGETGNVLYKSGATCAGIRQWTTPIAVKGHIVIGGDGHLCSWSPQ
jgi:hypothetical protein